MLQTLQRRQFKLTLNLNPLITTRHTTHPRKKLHLAAIVAKLPAQHQLLLVVNPDSFTILATPKGIRSQKKPKHLVQAPPLYLVSLNLIICANYSSTNYRILHFSYFRLFFSFHSLLFFAFTSFCHSHKIKLNGMLFLPTLKFLYLSPRSIVLLM